MTVLMLLTILFSATALFQMISIRMILAKENLSHFFYYSVLI